MTSLKALVKDCLPPLVTRRLQQIRDSGNRFEGSFPGWAEASQRATGYDTESIFARVLDATLKVKRGEAVFERDSVLFFEPEYAWPALTGLMWAAAQNNGNLNVLDYGGALGSSYFQHRKLLGTLPELRWNVIEQKHYVEAGKKYVQDETLKFYESLEACLLDQQPNAVLLSSVLQYVDDPEATVDVLVRAHPSIIILDRTIVNDSTITRHYVQHVSGTIYPASYACRSLSERRLIEWFSPDYQLVSAFPSLDFPALGLIDSMFKGFIFNKVGL